MALSLPSSYFNVALAKSPMNWVIVGVLATIWLLAFHAIMGGFTSLQSTVPGGAAGVKGSPGSTPVVAPQISTLTQFPTSDPSEIFTDSSEARFVGDGWQGNP